MQPNSRNPITPKFTIGVILVLMGVALALDQLGMLQANHLFRYWPAALVIVGLVMLQRGERHSALRALLLIVIGGWLLLNTLGFVSLDLWEFVWPLLLVFFGARIMMGSRYSRRGGPPDGGTTPGGMPGGTPGTTPNSMPGAFEAGPAAGAPPPAPGPGGFSGYSPTSGSTEPPHASLFALMSSSKRRWGKSIFRGAEATAFMGGCELDLRDALLAGDAPAVIDVFALMGGINIYVPVNWTVSQDVVPLLGGVQDKTRSIPSNPAQHLVVRGTVMMGGVEISN
jgi:predicted membrane protein